VCPKYERKEVGYMPKISEVKKLLAWCGDDDTIVCVAIWCVADVMGRAEERGMTITKEQAEEVLNTMDHKQDCSMGISWDTMDVYLDDLKGGK